MTEPTEILNIDFHRKRLLIKALNKAGSSEKAALLLGVSQRTVVRYKGVYRITRTPEGGYVEKQKGKTIGNN